jgi:pimeloyl-ACP methyl ester carboxylesterase
MRRFFHPVVPMAAISFIGMQGCGSPSTSSPAGGPQLAATATVASAKPAEPVRGYAMVNGLRMYYEIHGTGQPLVLLHGAFGVATTYPALSANRQVIAVELQGHGHTADIDRPLTQEQMADDTAALLKELKVEQADFFGYSMGGNVALAIAIRHPKLVRKLAIFGSNAGKIDDAYEPEMLQQFKNLPDDFAPPPLKGPYDQVAPDPSQWPILVKKIKKMGLETPGYSAEDLKSIKAPVLIALGDRDAVKPEHGVEMYRLIPNSQLAIFPGGDHFMVWQNPDKLFPTIASFLDAPAHAMIRMRPPAPAQP